MLAISNFKHLIILQLFTILNYIPHFLHLPTLHYLIMITHLISLPPLLLIYSFFYAYWQFLLIHFHQNHQIRLTLKMGVPTHHHILINHPFNQFIRLFHPQTHYYKNHNHKSYIHYLQNNRRILFLIYLIFRIPLIDFDR